MLLRSSLVGLGLALLPAIQAQSVIPFQCGTGELGNLGVDLLNDPTVLDRMAIATEELEEFTRQFPDATERGGGSYVIPIVFHIIHNNGPENIADAQIIDAVRVLNADFNQQNADWDNVRTEFQSIVANVGVEFRLATKDPNGNCTNGITRTVSALTYQGNGAMKDLIIWPRNKYVNVWVAASANGAAGYTNLPGNAQFNPNGDGIVLQHTYTGSIGTSTPSRSRTLTHEMGHFFNLMHTWGSGNNPELAANCNQDDKVTDTPNTVGWTSCSLSGTSCGSLDNVENFMEYSYCSKMFTNGQGSRMLAALNSSTAQRNSLWLQNNLINTGVNGNATLCQASFTSSGTVVCAGTTVTFTDQSYHNVSIRNWSFPGGSPSTSTELSPAILYGTGGVYPVTLTVSDGSSNLSTTTQNYIVVSSDPGQASPLIEGFEAATLLTDVGWTTGNTGTTGFGVTSTAAFTGSKSARILNTASTVSSINNLYGPTVDLSGAGSVSLSFRYAYAQRNTTNNDRLLVYVSNNCGVSWSLRKQMLGTTDLNTAGVSTGNFVPNSPSQWGLVEITNITSGYYVPDFRLRFEFQGDGGNNLYLDDININAISVGVEELGANAGADLLVVPNPATDDAQVVLNVTKAGQVEVDLVDVLGRTLSTLHQGVMSAGEQRLKLPVAGLSPGAYFVRMQQNGSSKVVRFMVR